MIAFDDGEGRDLMRNLVTADKSLIFVHRGKVYYEKPILLTAFTIRRDFVLAVAQQRQCDVDRLPWDRLQ
jgi:hypothetical protein